jgi:transposase
MGRAHSSDLRGRVYAAIAEGGSRRSAARRFGVSAATPVWLAQRQAQTGSLVPGRQGRPAGSGKLGAYREVVIGRVEADGELTLHEMAERLAAEHDLVVHHTSLSRLLRALRKKLCWPAKPIALTLPGCGECGARIAAVDGPAPAAPGVRR